MDTVRKIVLMGYERPNISTDTVAVYARFTGPDTFSGEVKSETRTISLSDSTMGMKWDEDNILYYVSDMFPMCEVQWAPMFGDSPMVPLPPTAVAVPAVEIIEAPVVSSDVEPLSDSTL